MTIRKWVLATTMSMLPLGVEAQPPQEPVYGFYIGGAGGFNIQTSQAVNNIMTNLPGAAGLTTPNTSVSTGIGAAAVGTVGYGLGNGFRVELEGDYRSNGFSNVSGNNKFGTSRSTGAGGGEQVFGPMVNLDYDFINLVPYVVPYVGIGLGYQRDYLHDFTVFGPRQGTTIHSGDNRGSFAVQGILGAAYDIEQVPGLNYSGRYFEVDHARLFDLPDTPVPIGIAVSGLESIQVAASHGDAMIATEPDGELVAQYALAGGEKRPRYGQLPLCYGPDEAACRARARELWRWAMPGWHVMAELPDERSFAAASEQVTEDKAAELVPCGPDTRRHVEAARQWVEAGFTHLALVQVGADQQASFIEWAKSELLPELRKLG